MRSDWLTTPAMQRLTIPVVRTRRRIGEKTANLRETLSRCAA
jgi:hypothetical protein